VGAARRQPQRPAREHGDETAGGIEDVRKREQVVLVGAAPVGEDQQPGRRRGGGALDRADLERLAQSSPSQ